MKNAWALTPLQRRALLVTIFARKTFYHSWLLAWRHSVTSHDVTWRHLMSQKCDMTCYVIIKWTVHSFSPLYASKITFFNLVTLTFDLWPWVSNSSEILSRYTPPPILVSVCQTVRLWECSQTGGQMDRRTVPKTLPRPLTRGGGGNEGSIPIIT